MPANQISVFLDPTQLPARTQDQATFESLMALFFSTLPTFGAQVNALVANLNMIGLGGGYSYTFDSTTTDADPGNGKVRLSSATQNTSTTIRIDTLGNDGKDWSAVVDNLQGVTSGTKGYVTLIKSSDPTQRLVFAITAGISNPGGYRNIIGTVISSSSANPFANGDLVQVFLTRAGDKGDKGDTANGWSNMVVIRSTQTWTPPAGIVKAKFTIIDGGQGGGSASGSDWVLAGVGGAASVSVRALSPSTTYTCTVGSGGAGGATNSGSLGSMGGSSSVSGTGFTTLTSGNGDIVVPGGTAATNGARAIPGGSLLSNPPAFNATSAAGIGGGAPGVVSGTAGIQGAAGAIIIEY